MKNKHKKTLLIISIAFVLSCTYLYSFYGDKSEAASSLSSSLGGTVNTTAGNDQISVDVSFVSALTSITKINIDSSLFYDVSFNALRDNTVNLDTNIPTGRINPFAVIDSNDSNNNLSYVVTNQPTQVNKTSAVLNGSINASSGATDSYFEYGTTEALGKITSSVNRSLIGTFIKQVDNLSSQTTYFFRAVARVNGSLQYGDIVSFTTN